jgi:hypothetical protein
MGCLLQSFLALALGGLVYLAILAVFAPWGFFLGGPFHIIPYWQGWGRIHSKISGDYALYVQFEPTSRGSRVLPASNLTGTAYLCSPRGERFRMHLGGSMRAHLNLSTNGEAIHLYMNNWPALTGGFIADHRPSLDLRGHWENPNLVMNDGGSLSRAFEADGTIYNGHSTSRPYAPEIVPITINQGSKSDFDAACQATHK